MHMFGWTKGRPPFPSREPASVQAQPSRRCFLRTHPPCPLLMYSSAWPSAPVMEPSARSQPNSLRSGATHDSSPRQSRLCSRCHRHSTSAQQYSFHHCSGTPCQSTCACLGDAMGQQSWESPTSNPLHILPDFYPHCPCGGQTHPARHQRFGADPLGKAKALKSGPRAPAP